MRPIKMTAAQLKALQPELLDVMPDLKKPRNKKEEAQHQKALVAHKIEKTTTYPDLEWLFSTLNGIFIPPHLLKNAKAAGMQKGILDFYWPLRREDEDGKIYSGLAMDLKKLKGGTPTVEQLRHARWLVKQGWRVYFPTGCVEAWWCLASFAGIMGADHLARELEQAERAIWLEHYGMEERAKER